MPIAPIASFANKEFSVSLNRIYPFTDFSLSGSINKEIQEREGQKPATYIKGLGLEALSISIPLVAQKNVNVRSELESWRTIRDARIPYYFIVAGKPIIPNKMLLESVELSDSIFDLSGNIVRGTLQLKFEEYAAAGSATKSASAKRANENCVDAILAGTTTE
ncbi:MAG: phage tail protein [Clostridiales bacterium]|jgi:hypothetical protein|nr:phage tail protein [Eubacteriales bacterium]MDH7566852.1 phage tail protein [Clostridiales bacterium]